MAFRDLPYHDLHLVLLMVSCFLAIAAATDTIRANESLSGSKGLISSGNRFKLSFFSLPNRSLWYVGIMFDIREMTVVWVANRNKPLNDSSGTFQISSDGNLVILDGQKEIVWSTNLSTSVSNHSAVLLDTGNLVLQDDSNNNMYVWESFQHASDSWLEKMKIVTDLGMNEKNILTSWTSPDDPTWKFHHDQCMVNVDLLEAVMLKTGQYVPAFGDSCQEARLSGRQETGPVDAQG
ncbi:G-type lectin S-receptor-like serine/threonine-protein kinase At1g11300 [Salvia hispanica]|uniref:G-type lectin S-receptor-like serine/threonine-protein kinase At1g11300 n=1 Tax=Salvia hispanica TaxID=49212 RepID=UPI00200900DC|nr:G-type lectin S-receptor-like serine/threonine-protein kinase At1g11300 [Salvia hispanica]